MSDFQLINSNQQNKYDEIIEYLKQDDGYWLENDKWDLTEEFFYNKKIGGSKFISFESIKNKQLKNEVKYFFVYNFKNKLRTDYDLVRISALIKYFSEIYNKNSLKTVDKDNLFKKWIFTLNEKGLSISAFGNKNISFFTSLIDFIKDFYDDREEIQKDIWYSKNIKGAKIPVSGANHTKFNTISFIEIPKYYRDTVKKYFRAFITKRSWSHLNNLSGKLRYFFDFYYKNGYSDGFLENLTRDDIEKYIYFVNTDLIDKSSNYKYQFVDYIRSFLEYIQMAQYDTAPKKEISFLIFKDDTPRRERREDYMRRTKFIPEPILKQLDNNITNLDRPQYIPIYILLRETGWRGTDILNLRYDNCLEQIWNNKEQVYNYYLCGEITKTGIAQLKIPIRDKVAEMVQKAIDKAKELSTEGNNPKRYLFNTYEGKLKGKPLNKASFLVTIQRLIEQKDIRDVGGQLYHFKTHSLRHTRAKEYVEQGMGLSIIQQILGHQSLQMTVHYATVTENTLYEKWKTTEVLDLFRVNTETHELNQIDLNSEDGENLIRYEYVKKNLDAVRVPFGVCFKPSKTPCRQQMNHCLTCGSFCTTVENIPEYEEEIDHVKKQIEISERCGRELWAEKNKTYLSLLENTLEKVKEQKIVHKNGNSREDI